MAQARRGRPPTPLNPDASHAAKLGAELRDRRTDAGLTLEQLGERIGFSQQHISEVERAKTTPALAFVAAVDHALDAHGAIERLLPPVLQDREDRRQERAEARRAATTSSLPCASAHSEVGDEDVEPTSRRGLLGAGAAAAIGLSAAGTPAAARDVDPELPAHLTALLALLGRHDALCGPHEVLGVVRRELRRIAEYRDAARGELRVALMRVEARWSEFGAWLAHDSGDVRSRDALLDHALHLARESDYADLTAWARARQAQWTDAPRALRLAEAGARTPHANAQTRAWCAARVAHSHARIGDVRSAQRALNDVAILVEQESPPPPRMVSRPIEQRHLSAWEARCWAILAPHRAIPLFEALLRDWPRELPRDGGLHRARLAWACASAGELDRAKVEAARALAIVKRTRSATAARELRQLGAVLNA